MIKLCFILAKGPYRRVEGQRDQKGQQQQDYRLQLSEVDSSQRNLVDLFS